MSSFMRRSCFVALLLFAAAGHAQRVLPPSPTSADDIIIVVETPTPGYVPQPVQISGSTITIQLRGRGEITMVDSHNVAIGKLAPGTYTVVVQILGTDEFGNVVDVQTWRPFTFAVAQGHFVPALDWRGLSLLAAALALTALVTIARR